MNQKPITTQTPSDPQKPKGKEEALKALLKLVAENPDLADRITITIKPSKIIQGTDKK